MSKDLLLDAEGDIFIKDGDFAIGESTQQEIKLLLTSKKGEWKLYPLVGANIQQFLKQREGITSVIREGKIQLKNDGLVINKFKIEDNKINIDAERI